VTWENASDAAARSTPLTCMNDRPRQTAGTTRLTYWRALLVEPEQSVHDSVRDLFHRIAGLASVFGHQLECLIGRAVRLDRDHAGRLRDFLPMHRSSISSAAETSSAIARTAFTWRLASRAQSWHPGAIDGASEERADASSCKGVRAMLMAHRSDDVRASRQNGQP
jgi:TPP-dependent trihydroxycyclohexane-1,2-dione (THcHDO) dehydratase